MTKTLTIKFLKPGYRIALGPNGHVSIKADRLSTFYELDMARLFGIIA